MWPFKRRCKSRYVGKYVLHPVRSGVEIRLDLEEVVRCQENRGHSHDHVHDTGDGIVYKWRQDDPFGTS